MEHEPVSGAIVMELPALVRSKGTGIGPEHTMDKRKFVQVLLKEDSSFWPIRGPYYVPVDKWNAEDLTVGGQKIRLFRLEREDWGKKLEPGSHYPRGARSQ